ncbi:prepilin peptidase CpaA [Janthinobacterium sp. CG_23.3]|uniref:prepilin peptidase n=1 Tax=Janthinobacterium sp. CG_23.3 TaxID=3349634 RepID=UPI0038D3E465
MATPVLLETVLLCCVATAAATDLAWRKIPNALVLAGLGAALLLQAGAPLAWLGGALTGLLLFLPLYVLRGMAAGDVKLMAMVGAFTGAGPALLVGLATLLIGGAMALAIVLLRRRGREALANVRALLSHALWRAAGVPLAAAPPASVGGMPYGVAIALGTASLVWWRHL